MKHAGATTLDSLRDMLDVIRSRPELTEKKPGIFYRKSTAFLHFHEDAAGLFADLKTGERFERFAVSTAQEREALLAYITKLLKQLAAHGSTGSPRAVRGTCASDPGTR